MTNTFTSCCILCGNQAKYSEIDRGNRKYYECLSSGNEYEISKRAEQEILDNSDFKTDVIAIMNSIPNNKYISIYHDLEKGMVFCIKNRE